MPILIHRIGDVHSWEKWREWKARNCHCSLSLQKGSGESLVLALEVLQTSINFKNLQITIKVSCTEWFPRNPVNCLNYQLHQSGYFLEIHLEVPSDFTAHTYFCITLTKNVILFLFTFQSSHKWLSMVVCLPIQGKGWMRSVVPVFSSAMQRKPLMGMAMILT
jgi:hypothetical protein